MTKDNVDLPDMDDLTRQMEDAMAEAQKAIQDLPAQMEGLGDMMGALSAMMGSLPEQLDELSNATAGFEEQHAANAASMAGEPDWSLDADIRVGTKLHLTVNAVFDLAQIQQAWDSTQGAGFEALVGGIVAANAGDLEDTPLSQITEQLQKGRSVALVEDVDVLACHIQGAPGNAAETLQLSPEGNIPLAMDEGGLSFEFAPLLTIRNRWEHANIPTFSPMGEDIVVPLAQFASGKPFTLTFEPAGQAESLTITLNFEPLS